MAKHTVEDVRGLELVKLRRQLAWGGKEYFDAMFPEAAMAGEYRGDDYIKQFLMSEFRSAEHPERRGPLGPHLTGDGGGVPPTLGYRFIEYVDEPTHQRYRCVATWKRGERNWVDGQHRCDPVQNSQARYALDYEDAIDPADRALWIAGTKLKVIDKQSGETIAELTRYVWDAGFGSSATGRWPWQYASTTPSMTCPYERERPPGTDSRYFVDTVLKPSQAD